MHPILIDFGPFSLHTYGFFMALGYVVALFWTTYEIKKANLPHEIIPDVGISIILAAVVGARLLYVLLKLPYFLNNPLEIFMLWNGGMVFSGGLALGFAVGLWEAKRRQQPFLRWLDCVAPAIALGQALGRLGCFAAGCCYGCATNVPWGVTFSDKACLAPLGVSLHPTQIYHFASGIATFAILILLRSRLPRDGQRTGLYLVLFALFRIIIEFYRADFRGVLGPLSITQVTTVAFGLLGLWLLFFNKQRRT